MALTVQSATPLLDSKEASEGARGMTLVLPDDVIGQPPPAPPARPRVLLIGTGFTLAGIVLAFAGLIGLYVGRRAAALEANNRGSRRA